MVHPEEFPSEHEDLETRVATIEWVQSMRDQMISRDRLLGGHRYEVGSQFNSQGVHVVESVGSANAPIQHHCMVLVPLPRREPILGVTYLFLRVPTPYQTRQIVGGPDDGMYVHDTTPQWNDVLIEIMGERGQPLGYHLLNHEGFGPYQTIANREEPMHAGEVADVFRNPFFEFTRDYFFNTGAAEIEVAKLPISDFKQMLHDYVPSLQDRNE